MPFLISAGMLLAVTTITGILASMGSRRICRRISRSDTSGIMISNRMISGFLAVIMAMAGMLEDVFSTRKPLTRIISANSSAASASSSMIKTVFSGGVIDALFFEQQ